MSAQIQMNAVKNLKFKEISGLFVHLMIEKFTSLSREL